MYDSPHRRRAYRPLCLSPLSSTASRQSIPSVERFHGLGRAPLFTRPLASPLRLSRCGRDEVISHQVCKIRARSNCLGLFLYKTRPSGTMIRKFLCVSRSRKPTRDGFLCVSRSRKPTRDGQHRSRSQQYHGLLICGCRSQLCVCPARDRLNPILRYFYTDAME